MSYPEGLLELVNFEKSNKFHSVLTSVKVEISGILNTINKTLRYSDIEKFWVHIFCDDFEFKTRMDLKFIHQIGSRIKWNEEKAKINYTLEDITTYWRNEIVKDPTLNTLIKKIEDVFWDPFLKSGHLVIIYYGEQNPFLIYGIVSNSYIPSSQLEFRDKFIEECQKHSKYFDLANSKVFYNKEFKSVTEYFLFYPQEEDAFILSCGLVYGKNNGYGSYSIEWRRVTKQNEAIFLPIQSTTKTNWKNNPRYIHLPNEGINDFVKNVVEEGIKYKNDLEERYKRCIDTNFSENIVKEYFQKILDKVTIAFASKERVIDQWEKEYLNKNSEIAFSSWAICETLTFVGTHNRAIPERMKKLLRQAGSEIFDSDFDTFFKIHDKDSLSIKFTLSTEEQINYTNKQEQISSRLNNSHSNTEIIAKERETLIKSEAKFTWETIFKNKLFFNQLFSTFFCFDEYQLVKYYGKLEIGSPYLTDGFYTIQKTIFGLVYNQDIKWTEQLKSKYYREPELITVTENADVYSFHILFDRLPLSILDDMESEKTFYETRIAVEHGLAYDGNYSALYDDLNNVNEYYKNIISKSHFTNDVTMDIIENNKTYYFFNTIFYDSVLSKLKSDIQDFNIDYFYENY